MSVFNSGEKGSCGASPPHKPHLGEVGIVDIGAPVIGVVLGATLQHHLRQFLFIRHLPDPRFLTGRVAIFLGGVRRILDATVLGGKLQVFPKIDYAEFITGSAL